MEFNEDLIRKKYKPLQNSKNSMPEGGGDKEEEARKLTENSRQLLYKSLTERNDHYS